MNREIKFRAWHPLVKKMFSMFEAMTYQPFTPDFFSWYSENKWALMQFTGLRDKNGKDIYEGDIFKPFSEGINYYKVVFEKGCFGLHHNCGYWGTLGRFFELANENKMEFEVEVIGNIYENPKLLETKKAQLSEPKVE